MEGLFLFYFFDICFCNIDVCIYFFKVLLCLVSFFVILFKLFFILKVKEKGGRESNY